MKIKNLTLVFLVLNLMFMVNFFGGNLKVKATTGGMDGVLVEDKSLKPEAKAPKLSKEEKLKNFELVKIPKTFNPNEEILIYRHKDTGMKFIVLPKRLSNYKTCPFELYISAANVKNPSGKYTYDMKHLLEHNLFRSGIENDELLKYYYRDELTHGKASKNEDDFVTEGRFIGLFSSNLNNLENILKEIVDPVFLKPTNNREIFSREALKKIPGETENSIDVIGRVIAECVNMNLSGFKFDENGILHNFLDLESKFNVNNSSDETEGNFSIEFKNLDPDYVYNEVCRLYYKLFSDLSRFVMFIPNLSNIPNNPNYEDILHFVEVNFIDRLKVKQQEYLDKIKKNKEGSLVLSEPLNFVHEPFSSCDVNSYYQGFNGIFRSTGETRQIKKIAYMCFDNFDDANKGQSFYLNHIFQLVKEDINTYVNKLKVPFSFFCKFDDFNGKQKFRIFLIGPDDSFFTDSNIKNSVENILKKFILPMSVDDVIKRLKEDIEKNRFEYLNSERNFILEDLLHGCVSVKEAKDIDVDGISYLSSVFRKYLENPKDDGILENLRPYFSEALTRFKSFINNFSEYLKDSRIYVINNSRYGIEKGNKDYFVIKYPMYRVWFNWPEPISSTISNVAKFYASKLLFRVGISGGLGSSALFYRLSHDKLYVRKADSNGNKAGYTYSIFLPIISKRGYDEFFGFRPKTVGDGKEVNETEFEKYRSKFIELLEENLKNDPNFFEKFKNDELEVLEETIEDFNKFREENGYGIEDLKNLTYRDFLEAVKQIKVSGPKIYEKDSLNWANSPDGIVI